MSTHHAIGKDLKTGKWYDAYGKRVPCFNSDGTPFSIEIEIGELIPELACIESIGNENIYFRGVSGLTYFCKCL